ncbi:hypothetical protein HA402_000896 [Bradysia odoriphaga]|nr:hypothetical protein HA402_000896 [Bradysia odoriphaga]
MKNNNATTAYTRIQHHGYLLSNNFKQRTLFESPRINKRFGSELLVRKMRIVIEFGASRPSRRMFTLLMANGRSYNKDNKDTTITTIIMDELMECPFNSSHRIIRHRMPNHLVKCKKSYIGPPLESCPYNAMHMVPKDKMAPHLMDCRDYHIAQGVAAD